VFGGGIIRPLSVALADGLLSDLYRQICSKRKNEKGGKLEKTRPGGQIFMRIINIFTCLILHNMI
jgi:hypothetical protein